ncbi:MAG: RNA polymerase sigma factor [Gemmataceae bacterium]
MNTNQASEFRTRQRPSAQLCLISRVQQGEEEAFATLYGRHKRRIYGLCLHLAGTAEDAEDLTQQVFVCIFRKISELKTEGEFAAALNELTIKLAISRRRERKCAERGLHLLREDTERGNERPGESACALPASWQWPLRLRN